MKQFRVKALSFHSDKTQKVYKAGDIIPASAIHEDAIDKAVGDGWIEEYHGKKNEHSASQGTPHVVTAADVERNPNAGLKEGDTVYLPLDGFVLDDTENQATNEEGLADHDGGKVLVTADQAKAPIVNEPEAPKPEKIILPGGEKVDSKPASKKGK